MANCSRAYAFADLVPQNCSKHLQTLTLFSSKIIMIVSIHCCRRSAWAHPVLELACSRRPMQTCRACHRGWLSLQCSEKKRCISDPKQVALRAYQTMVKAPATCSSPVLIILQTTRSMRTGLKMLCFGQTMLPLEWWPASRARPPRPRRTVPRFVCGCEAGACRNIHVPHAGSARSYPWKLWMVATRCNSSPFAPVSWAETRAAWKCHWSLQPGRCCALHQKVK